MKMGWYKFLINFALWLGAIANLAMGVAYLTGLIYSGDKELVYSVFTSIKYYDTAYGIGCCLLAVLQIVARFSLAGYKKNGPALLNFCYFFGAAISLVYVLMVDRLLPPEASTFADVFPSIIVSIAILIYNVIYFRKRKELFVY